MDTTSDRKPADLIAVAASAKWHKGHINVAVVGYYGSESNSVPYTLLEADCPQFPMSEYSRHEQLVERAGDALVIVFQRILSP